MSTSPAAAVAATFAAWVESLRGHVKQLMAERASVVDRLDALTASMDPYSNVLHDEVMLELHDIDFRLGQLRKATFTGGPAVTPPRSEYV
ncbi:MAG: hypothetical protein U1F67_10420 [Rubrivivax sp.]